MRNNTHLRAIKLIAALSCASFASKAVADEQGAYSLQGVVKAYSVDLSFISRCSAFYVVDVQQLSSALAAYAQIATQTSGKVAFFAALSDELIRRDQEINSVGVANWCRYKKSDYIAAGLGTLFQ